MKKYFVLTSVLALCACGGGSGGGGGGSGAPVTPTNVRSAITDADVLSSNSNVTKMATEILVANDNSGTPILNRSATVRQNGHTYTSYRLDDVNFRIATGANDAFLRLKMDDAGKINALVADLGQGNQFMDRYGDTNMFRGIVYEYVETDATPGASASEIAAADDGETLVRMVFAPSKDAASYSVLQNAAGNKCPSGKVCRWDRIDQAFRVNAQGTNFKYSDFGTFETTNFTGGKTKNVTADNFDTATTPVEHNATEWNNLTFDGGAYMFAGGYNVDAVQHRPTTDMTFSGKAMGNVYATNSLHQKYTTTLTDNNATLEFDANSGDEILTMNFNNDASKWYKVTVTNNERTHTKDIDFTNPHANINDNAKFKTATSFDNFTTTNGDTVDSDGDIKTEGMLDMGYYGINSTEEATGIVRFKETSQIDGVKYEREFNAGYGMTPDSH